MLIVIGALLSMLVLLLPAADARAQPHVLTMLQLDRVRTGVTSLDPWLPASLARSWRGRAAPSSAPRWARCPSGPAVVQVVPSEIDLGRVRVGETAERMVTLVNRGPGVVRFRPRVRCDGFALLPSIEGAVPLLALEPGRSASWKVRFRPAAPGPIRCGIPLPGGGHLRCAAFGVLSGVACEVSPDVLSFGPVLPGVRASRSVTVTNIGEQAISGGAFGGGFGFGIPDGESVMIEPGASASFEVWFEPPAPGSYSCDVAVGGAGLVMIPCTGTGSDGARRLAVADRSDSTATCVLHRSYPNPCSDTTVIGLEVPEERYVRLEIFDVAGRRIRTLVDGELTAASHDVLWDGKDSRGRPVPSGVYCCAMYTRFAAAMTKLQVVR